MIGLVGVAGLAGAGKTTAVEYLSRVTSGQFFYLGETVLEAVHARGLSETPDNQRQVRIDLRREKGPGALAIPYINKITECFGIGIPVFVDAIFNREELDVLADHVPTGSAHLLAIEASFDVRSARVAHRPKNPLTADELRRRDKTELEILGTGAVMAAAEYTIRNEETLEEFYRRLEAFVSCWA